MPVFKPNQPIDTQEPVILVEIDPANPLKVGKHHFQLIVLDDSNPQLQSDPITVEINIVSKPVAVITGPTGPVVANTAFRLVGDQSSPAGHIKTWRWTMLD